MAAIERRNCVATWTISRAMFPNSGTCLTGRKLPDLGAECAPHEWCTIKVISNRESAELCRTNWLLFFYIPFTSPQALLSFKTSRLPDASSSVVKWSFSQCRMSVWTFSSFLFLTNRSFVLFVINGLGTDRSCHLLQTNNSFNNEKSCKYEKILTLVLAYECTKPIWFFVCL